MRFIHRVLVIFSIALLVFFAGCSEDDSKEPADNRAPNAPMNPVPADSAMFQSVTVDLKWSCSDPDGDPLVYDVYFGTTNNPPLVSSNIADTTYDPDTLLANQMYYWRIVAHDNQSHATDGPLWKFTTGAGAPAGMVAIPACTFIMGAAYQAWATPEHEVTVSPFFMDIYEVTNDEYKQFCDATGHSYPPNPNWPGYSNFFTNPAYAHYPVINVYWQDAHDYAAWAGKRLPTEAEWELAKKGSQDNRLWPWGNTWNEGWANMWYDGDAYHYTAPVGSFPNDVSPFGCYDMTGNVTEWCEDDGHTSYIGAPADGSAWIDSPRANNRVMRGGTYSWVGGEMSRCAWRNFGGTNAYWDGSGFRCAKTL
ncbi:hypothetical protein EHM69_09245 [candidate division KSB1 bacterium]|nr:MAG: hypothetical protein EHM69_09245 [candidate division KSB1 bacterium]